VFGGNFCPLESVKIYNMGSNGKIYALVKKPIITGTIKFDKLHWFGHIQRMEEYRISKKVLYMNLEKNKDER
jgi:hypothetical protein